MSYRIHPGEPAGEEVRRVATEQLDRALAELEDPTLDRHEAIHQVRKRCKKLRGLLRLCRGVLGKRYRRENARYRDAARRLSGLRDAEALIETYDRLLDRYDGPLERQLFGPVRRRLTLEKESRANESLDLETEIAEFADELVRGRGKVESWAGKVRSLDDLIEGFRRNYARGRKAMSAAFKQPGGERFHEWRKRTKYLSYHFRLIEPVWKPVMRAHRRETERLADLLGREHDLTVFDEQIERGFGDYGNPEVITVLKALIEEERDRLRREAGMLGRRVYAEKPGEIATRLGRILRSDGRFRGESH